jgi:hypothetical protein
MKNKSLVIWTLAISLLSISSFASADFDCSTVNREEIKTLMDKQQSWETLTTDEQSLLESSKNCKPERTGSWELSWSWMVWWKRNMMSWSWFTQENNEQFNEIRTLIEKKKNGETLTSDEETKISEFEAKKQNFWSWTTENKSKQKDSKNSKSTSSESNINSLYKTKIDNKVDALISNSSLDSNSKLEVLEKFLKNLEKVQKNLNSSSSLTDAKKSTYNELIDYFMESVTIKINKINEEQISDENLDGIINQIFWE